MPSGTSGCGFMHNFRYGFKTGTAAASARLAVMSDIKVKDALQRVLSREHLFLHPTRGKTIKERGTRCVHYWSNGKINFMKKGILVNLTVLCS